MTTGYTVSAYDDYELSYEYPDHEKHSISRVMHCGRRRRSSRWVSWSSRRRAFEICWAPDLMFTNTIVFALLADFLLLPPLLMAVDRKNS